MGTTLPNAMNSSNRLRPSSNKGSYSGSSEIGKIHQGTLSPTYGLRRPRALLREIRVIVRGSAMVGSSKKARKMYLRMV